MPIYAHLLCKHTSQVQDAPKVQEDHIHPPAVGIRWRQAHLEAQSLRRSARSAHDRGLNRQRFRVSPLEGQCLRCQVGAIREGLELQLLKRFEECSGTAMIHIPSTLNSAALSRAFLARALRAAGSHCISPAARSGKTPAKVLSKVSHCAWSCRSWSQRGPDPSPGAPPLRSHIRAPSEFWDPGCLGLGLRFGACCELNHMMAGLDLALILSCRHVFECWMYLGLLRNAVTSAWA